MTSIMRIDIVRWKVLAYFCVAICLVFIVVIIVGATGPSIYDVNEGYVYSCEGNSHVWNPLNCTGPQLSQNQTWYFFLDDLGLLNRFWVLEMFPYNILYDKQDLSIVLDVEVTLLGSNDLKNWDALNVNDIHSEQVECSKGSENDQECSGFILIFEEFIHYYNYRVEVSLPNSENNYFVGDMHYRFQFVRPSFSSLDIIIRIFYLLLSVSTFIFMFFTLKSLSTPDWTYEQKAVVLLCIALVAFNNPFYGFEFAVKGWFFQFLNALFHTVFLCSLFLFWLLISDKIRKDESAPVINVAHYGKFLIVFIFGILSLILFAWISIRDASDPVYGTSIDGVIVLFYFIAVIYTGTILWVSILMALSIPVVKRKPYLKVRFLFFAVPTAICIISILGSVLAGSFGPFRQTTISFMYFISMYNWYVLTLMWGYWPVSENSFGDGNPSESMPLRF